MKREINQIGEILYTAYFSECRKYRYALSRIWDTNKEKILFIGLNPPTAGAEKDDPTIRRF